MKRLFLPIILFTVFTFCTFAQQTILVQPREIIRLGQIKYDKLQITDDSNSSAIGPIYEPERGLVFIMQEGIYRFDDNFQAHFIKMPTFAAWSAPSIVMSSRTVTVSGSIGIRVLRYGERYSEDDTYQRLGAIDNALLIDNMMVRADGSSLVIESNMRVRELDRTATLEYAKINIPGATVEGLELYYRGNKVGRTNYTMIDDDGNFYDAGVVQREGAFYNHFAIELPQGGFPMFDHEGNILVTKHSPTGVIVLYAGRTWGYLEPARKAVVTSDNVRIRLRSNTNSFILGMVQDKEPVTVLKVGPTATIGGQTAPWYRIQTASGLVGWAFGAFVDIKD